MHHHHLTSGRCGSVPLCLPVHSPVDTRGCTSWPLLWIAGNAYRRRHVNVAHGRCSQVCSRNPACSSGSEGGAVPPGPWHALCCGGPRDPWSGWAGTVREARASNRRPGATQRPSPLTCRVTRGAFLRRNRHPCSPAAHKPLLTRGLGDPSWVTPAGRQHQHLGRLPVNGEVTALEKAPPAENHKQSRGTPDPRPTPAAASKPRAPPRPVRFQAFPCDPRASSAPGARAGGDRDLPPRARTVVLHGACRSTEGGKDEKSRDPRPERGAQCSKELSLHRPRLPTRVLWPPCAHSDTGRGYEAQKSCGLVAADPDAGFWVCFPTPTTGG
ncbi:uncharacterized protein LOC118544470 isoform X2 [Halichoerus grypus]